MFRVEAELAGNPKQGDPLREIPILSEKRADGERMGEEGPASSVLLTQLRQITLVRGVS